MYNYKWDLETGGYILDPKTDGTIKEVRPVYREELRLLGFDEQFGWIIPEVDEPLMWAEGRRYIYFGEAIAETIGGGLYERPILRSEINNLMIKQVDVKKMINKNKYLMDGIEQRALKQIYNYYKKYSEKVDIIYVAFSGGKDSIVLLDIVQRVLPHNAFKVIFANTTMELSDTYITIEFVQKKYNDLEWYNVSSHLSAPESWKLLGPPSEKIRWCCSVHKTVPQVLLIKKIIGKSNFKTLVFVGVRAEESELRSKYDEISESKKHIMQTSCSPILKWNTSELFLYLLKYDLFFNNAYKKGLTRVGCIFCPMSSRWSFFINQNVEKERVEKYITILDSLFILNHDTEEAKKAYFTKRHWKLRLNGRDIAIGTNNLIETNSENTIEFLLISPNINTVKQWLSTIGTIISISPNELIIEYKELAIKIYIQYNNENVKLIIQNNETSLIMKHFFFLLRNVLYKIVYCRGCMACVVECPVGAIKMSKDGDIEIKGCIHCENCLNMKKGCIRAQSLTLPLGGSRMKNLAAYQKRGFRQDWLNLYFSKTTDFWMNNQMGPNMIQAFKAWMRDAELLSNSSATPLCEALKRLGGNNNSTWAIIFNNLAYNSSIINWFIFSLQFDVCFDNDFLKDNLGDNYTDSVKESAIRSLKETLKSSPIGTGLKLVDLEMKGNTIVMIKKHMWQNPEPLVILYSLYKYAEKSDGLYEFTLSALFNKTADYGGISPVKLYNLGRDVLQQIIEGLSRDYPDYIRANFNKGVMEDIYLTRTKSSLDIVDLF